MKRLYLGLLAIVSCSGDTESTPLETIDSVRVSRPMVVNPDSLPELAIPEAGDQQISLVAGGSMELDASGSYQASFCEENSSTVLVEADGPLDADERWGIVMVITPGDSGYTVTRREGGVPERGTVQVAVQRIIPTSADRYQAIDGVVEVQIVDSTLSGTFNLVVRAWEGRNFARLVGALGSQRVSFALSGNCRFDEPAD